MQNTFSQNKEDLFVLNYFGDYKGTLLEIGANDGITLSNSKLLIDNGWSAHLVEPGSIFNELSELHKGNDKVVCYNFGIGELDEKVSFYESGAHVKDGNDKGLVSSVLYDEATRWANMGVEFIETDIQLIEWANFVKRKPQFDFISIDAEGYDWLILKQIDLDSVGCKCLIIEWNSNPELLELFTNYCKGYSLALMNAENLIFVK